MLSIKLVTVFFNDLSTHLTNGGEQVRRNASELVRIGGVDENANRQINRHLFETLFFPVRNRAKRFCGGILIMHFVDLTAFPDHFHIACARLIALLCHHLGKQNLIDAGLEADTLSFLYICADFYDQLCIFS